MSSKLLFIPFAIALSASSGCTTLQTQRREIMREQSEVERLAVEVNRYKARIEALETAQNRVYERLEDLQRSAAAERADLSGRVAGLERGIKALDAAREQDRQAIVDSLTQKISGLMQQTRAASAPRAQSGYEHVVQPGEVLSAIAAAYNVTVNAIVKANNLKNPDSLRVGQKLFIPE